jgi:hypothetical protein
VAFFGTSLNTLRLHSVPPAAAYGFSAISSQLSALLYTIIMLVYYRDTFVPMKKGLSMTLRCQIAATLFGDRDKVSQCKEG